MFVEARPIGGWDVSVYVLSGCGDLGLSNRMGCPLNRRDGAGPSAVVFENDQNEPGYVIVDGSNGEAGEFELRWGPADCQQDGDCASRSCVDYQCQ